MERIIGNVKIVIPLKGKARVLLPYATNNYNFIRSFSHNRSKYDATNQTWTVDKSNWNLVVRECVQKYVEVEVWRSYKINRLVPEEFEEQKFCTSPCLGARPSSDLATFDATECKCICTGAFHSMGMPPSGVIVLDTQEGREFTSTKKGLLINTYWKYVNGAKVIDLNGVEELGIHGEEESLFGSSNPGDDGGTQAALR